ncbi:hypothetical protein PG987_014541 [Apiospora arundinis]
METTKRAAATTTFHTRRLYSHNRPTYRPLQEHHRVHQERKRLRNLLYPKPPPKHHHLAHHPHYRHHHYHSTEPTEQEVSSYDYDGVADEASQEAAIPTTTPALEQQQAFISSQPLSTITVTMYLHPQVTLAGVPAVSPLPPPDLTALQAALVVVCTLMTVFTIVLWCWYCGQACRAPYLPLYSADAAAPLLPSRRRRPIPRVSTTVRLHSGQEEGIVASHSEGQGVPTERRRSVLPRPLSQRHRSSSSRSSLSPVQEEEEEEEVTESTALMFGGPRGVRSARRPAGEPAGEPERGSAGGSVGGSAGG